jgi:hypothetical protein
MRRGGGARLSIATFFWVIYILWCLLGVFWANYPFSAASMRPMGGSLILLILLFLLGWKVMGFPIHN